MKLYVVFDGPPDHVPGRFVEVENAQGQSVATAPRAWEPYPGSNTGLWRLGPFYAAPGPTIAQLAAAMHAYGLPPGGCTQNITDSDGLAIVTWQDCEHREHHKNSATGLLDAIANAPP